MGIRLVLFTLCYSIPAFIYSQDDYVRPPVQPSYIQSPKLNTNAIGEGVVLIEAYYGMPYIWGGVLKTYFNDSAAYYGVRVTNMRNTNHLGIRGEFIISEKIGIGVEYTYANFFVEFRDSYNVYQAGLRKQRLLLKLNMHFATTKNFDPYFNVGTGYRTTMSYSTSTNVNYDDDERSVMAFFPIALRLGLGFRYLITSNIGINTEVGLGGPLVQFGFTYKI